VLLLYSGSCVLIFLCSSVSNVLSFVAEKTGYKNVKIPASQVPQFNLTGVAAGALSAYSSFLTLPFSAKY
jgi:hypothetical protein